MFCGVRLFGFFVRMFVGLNDFSRFQYRRTMCFYPAVIFSVCHSVCSDVFLIIDTAASVVPPRTICRHSDCKIAALFFIFRILPLALTLRKPPGLSGRSVSGPAGTVACGRRKYGNAVLATTDGQSRAECPSGTERSENRRLCCPNPALRSGEHSARLCPDVGVSTHSIFPAARTPQSRPAR